MATNRSTPEWGRAIFSDLCVILRPGGPDDVSSFLKYALGLTRAHLQLARLVQPVQSNRRAQISSPAPCHCSELVEGRLDFIYRNVPKL